MACLRVLGGDKDQVIALRSRVKKNPNASANGVPMKITTKGTPTAKLKMVDIEMPLNSATNIPNTGNSTKACKPKLCQRVNGEYFGD